MSEENPNTVKKNDSENLAIGIFIAIVVSVIVITGIVLLYPSGDGDTPDPTAVVLVTTGPVTPAPFEPTATFFPTPTQIFEGTAVVSSDLPEAIFALITPLDLVGDSPADPTDGLNVRVGPSVDDEITKRVYAGEVLPLYGVDEEGLWCLISTHGTDWVSCEFTRPVDPEDCFAAPSVSPYIDMTLCEDVEEAG